MANDERKKFEKGSLVDGGLSLGMDTIKVKLFVP